MIYNWEINGLVKDNVDTFNDVITNIIFRVSVTYESGIYCFYDGNIRLDLSNLNEQTFLALNQLNNDILLEWLESSVKADIRYWNHVNELIDTQHRMKENNSLTETRINPL